MSGKPQAEPHALDAHPGATSELLVLLVTDDPHLRAVTPFSFPSGVEVLIASDARDAWLQMQDVTPSVAVVDLHTGSAGGFALARDMAADGRLSQVPLLMLLERSEDAWLAGQAGARSYRVKPVEAGRLVADTLALLRS